VKEILNAFIIGANPVNY